jgi:hypothetical protein
MTRLDWNSNHDIQELVESLRPFASERKSRLFACARCRSYWSLMIDEPSRKAVEIAEKFADGLASDAERATAHRHASDAAEAEEYEDPEDEETYLAAMAAAYASHAAWDNAYVAAHATAPPLIIPDPDAHALAVAQLRDIFGYLDGSAILDSEWRSPEVVDLANSMYERNAFGSLFELADALQRSGCDNDSLLNHCREGTSHTRGCWVVDLVLTKT